MAEQRLTSPARRRSTSPLRGFSAQHQALSELVANPSTPAETICQFVRAYPELGVKIGPDRLPGYIQCILNERDVAAIRIAAKQGLLTEDILRETISPINVSQFFWLADLRPDEVQPILMEQAQDRYLYDIHESGNVEALSNLKRLGLLPRSISILLSRAANHRKFPILLEWYKKNFTLTEEMGDYLVNNAVFGTCPQPGVIEAISTNFSLTRRHMATLMKALSNGIYYRVHLFLNPHIPTPTEETRRNVVERFPGWQVINKLKAPLLYLWVSELKGPKLSGSLARVILVPSREFYEKKTDELLQELAHFMKNYAGAYGMPALLRDYARTDLAAILDPQLMLDLYAQLGKE